MENLIFYFQKNFTRPKTTPNRPEKCMVCAIEKMLVSTDMTNKPNNFIFDRIFIIWGN